eukprot:481836-Rhodomonas_salina.1
MITGADEKKLDAAAAVAMTVAAAIRDSKGRIKQSCPPLSSQVLKSNLKYVFIPTRAFLCKVANVCEARGPKFH